MRLCASINHLDPLLMCTKNCSQQSAGCCRWQAASDLSISYHPFNRPLYMYLLPCTAGVVQCSTTPLDLEFYF